LAAELLVRERSLLRELRVLQTRVVAHLLVRKRCLHGRLLIHPLRLQAVSFALNTGLLLVREISKRSLHPGLRTKLLDA